MFPILDATSAELEIHSFEKVMSSAKLTFETEKIKRAETFIHKDKLDQARKIIAEKMQPTDLMRILEDNNVSYLFPNLMKLLSFNSTIP